MTIENGTPIANVNNDAIEPPSVDGKPVEIEPVFGLANEPHLNAANNDNSEFQVSLEYGGDAVANQLELVNDADNQEETIEPAAHEASDFNAEFDQLDVNANWRPMVSAMHLQSEGRGFLQVNDDTPNMDYVYAGFEKEFVTRIPSDDSQGQVDGVRDAVPAHSGVNALLVDEEEVAPEQEVAPNANGQFGLYTSKDVLQQLKHAQQDAQQTHPTLNGKEIQNAAELAEMNKTDREKVLSQLDARVRDQVEEALYVHDRQTMLADRTLVVLRSVEKKSEIDRFTAMGIDGDKLKRFNQIMDKVTTAKFQITKPKNMSWQNFYDLQEAEDKNVARLAGKDPVRFTKLFDMRKPRPKYAWQKHQKHGTTRQRHAAYKILYKMAGQGYPIEVLEAAKLKLTGQMATAKQSKRHQKSLDSQMATTVRNLQRNAGHPNLIEASFHVQGLATHKDDIGMSSMHFIGRHEAEHYTQQYLGHADAAYSDQRFVAHRDVMAEAHLSARHSGFIMMYLKDRMPHLRTDPNQPNPSANVQNNAANGDNEDDAAIPIQEQEFKEKMADLLKLSTFAGRSFAYKIPHMARPDEATIDKRRAKLQAIAYGVGMAHPEKVMNGELKKVMDDIAMFRDDQIDALLRLVNRDEDVRGKDELFVDLKSYRDSMVEKRVHPDRVGVDDNEIHNALHLDDNALQLLHQVDPHKADWVERVRRDPPPNAAQQQQINFEREQHERINEQLMIGGIM